MSGRRRLVVNYEKKEFPDPKEPPAATPEEPIEVLLPQERRLQLPLKVPFVQYTFASQDEESIDHRSSVKSRRVGMMENRLSYSYGKKKRQSQHDEFESDFQLSLVASPPGHS